MAFIKCPDCNADMHDTARECQWCGSTTYYQKNIGRTILLFGAIFAFTLLLLWIFFG